MAAYKPYCEDRSIVMAQRLRKLREELGKSREDVSTELSDPNGKFHTDISIDSIVKYEQSDTTKARTIYTNDGMKVGYLRAFSDYYGVSADYLLGNSNYRRDSLRYAAPEELGLSEKSIERISEIVTSYGRSEELNDLLSANELPMILDCFHKYKKACYALCLVVIADEHNVPLDGIETNDEEIQNMIKAYELSRDGKSEEWKLLRSVYGVFGMLDPMSTTKATITDTIDQILRGTAIDIDNHVHQIAADQFGCD